MRVCAVAASWAILSPFLESGEAMDALKEAALKDEGEADEVHASKVRHTIH